MMFAFDKFPSAGSSSSWTIIEPLPGCLLAEAASYNTAGDETSGKQTVKHAADSYGVTGKSGSVLKMIDSYPVSDALPTSFLHGLCVLQRGHFNRTAGYNPGPA
ncbi:MAG: hypothetical protein WBW79_05600 [Desulfocapsaceae bacterium]|jgi:hypothetical protein